MSQKEPIDTQQTHRECDIALVCWMLFGDVQVQLIADMSADKLHSAHDENIVQRARKRAKRKRIFRRNFSDDKIIAWRYLRLFYVPEMKFS